ncbi:CAMK/CAMKL protein kinase [Spizellomyces punctatus DAOM BR117]|uniref:CAMK/CAMKL protein kinase n=1 Tax=Spizellomyces punctatus (strain DAOM BR117) TaxID=645134 RepID=A0A0L0HDH6_SPIPD|nr:CAMK/CAMKL protein kinase [Spizellomyces punctatus DAOM BR117]KNC99182.1 CAMK/CAMKL protein kinase [Spizellomyces punctatus DAOM BR117]|eukprot:XP_016607222.1 CAMK/CAMKL protein kinase [Spizellomyces punctatus DAOM BR117]
MASYPPPAQGSEPSFPVSPPSSGVSPDTLFTTTPATTSSPTRTNGFASYIVAPQAALVHSSSAPSPLRRSVSRPLPSRHVSEHSALPRPRRIPFWRRLRRIFFRCFSFVFFLRPSSTTEHVRVKIRTDAKGRTVIKTRLIGRNTFHPFDDEDDEEEQHEEEEEEELQVERSIWQDWGDRQRPSLTGQQENGSSHLPADQTIAGGLADAADTVYDEVDNVMRVFAQTINTLPQELSNRYLFTGLLGYGGNGFVADALDRLDGKPVAAKFIARDRVAPASLIITDAYPFPIPVEADIMRNIKHPNIVGFLALYADDVFYVIIMEKVVHFLQHLEGDVQSLSNAESPAVTRNPTTRTTNKSSTSLTRSTTRTTRTSQRRFPECFPERFPDSPPTPTIPTSSSPSPITTTTTPNDIKHNDALSGDGWVTPPPPALADTSLRLTFLASRPQPPLTSLTRPRHGHPGDLDEFLALYHPLHPSIQRRLSRQLVSAYRELSLHNYCYLDFRGENVIITDTIHIKLVDFGMSQKNTGHFAVYGTRLFSAPEILAGGLYRGPEADIWALGCLLYMIATGGAMPFENIESALAGVVFFPESVEPDHRDFIKRMLTVQPYQRATVDEMCAHPWLRFREGEDI